VLHREVSQNMLGVLNDRMETDGGKAVLRERKKIIEHRSERQKAYGVFGNSSAAQKNEQPGSNR
jgi:ribosomal protein L34